MRLLRLSMAIAGFAAYTLSLAADPVTIQGGYSVEPLRHPVFDSAKVAVETTAFNNWLNTNYGNLEVDKMKGLREHLFYIITSRVAENYACDGVVYPSSHDLILETLFSWSERLGVFGGHLIYNSLKRDSLSEMKPLMKLPESITIALADDMLKVSSPSEGWSTKIPYYFTIWQISDFKATNGVRTQLFSLSTSAAKHEGQPGHSQATIMFMFAPGGDIKEFINYWSNLLQIAPDDDTLTLPVRSLKSHQRFDESTKMYTEFVSWPTRKGPIGVAYMGINGTFQTDRPHFLDFIRSVSVENGI